MSDIYRLSLSNCVIVRNKKVLESLSDYTLLTETPICLESSEFGNWPQCVVIESLNNTFPVCRSIRAGCVEARAFLDALNRKSFETIDLSLPLKCVSVCAVAGGGKTTALLNLVRNNPTQNILYLAFNKTIVDAARSLNIPNLKAMTFDSLICSFYNSQNPNFEIHELKPQRLCQLYPWMNNIPNNICKGIIKQFEQFCAQIETNSITTYFSGKKSRALESLWADTCAGKLFTFCGLRKLAHCECTLIQLFEQSYDAVVVDEAQDFDRIMLDILLRDCNKTKIFIGDPRQQIYQWRGSINAFDYLPESTVRLEFYKTFRIGEPACAYLSKETGVQMISGKKEPTCILEQTPTYPYIYLFRTWRGLLQAAQELECIWIAEFDRKMLMIRELHNRLHAGQKPQSSEFDDDLPTFLLTLSTDQLAALENNISQKVKDDASHAKIQMYTIHGFKGMEADNVRIASDINPNSEQNLYYVACTRCRQSIYIDKKVDSKPVVSSQKESKKTPVVSSQNQRESKKTPVVLGTDILTKKLCAFRKSEATSKKIPPYTILANRTIVEIVAKRPNCLNSLKAIHGIGPKSIERYGPQIIAVVTQD